MNKYPWFKCWPKEILGDTGFRSLSLEARGLLIELMMLMHESKDYGHLSRDGRALDLKTLARLVNVTPKKLKKLMDEVVACGYFGRKKNGVLFCRQLIRDRKRSEMGQKSVRKRYTQGSEKARESDAPTRSPTSKKLEARNQKQENRKEPFGSLKGEAIPNDWHPSAEIQQEIGAMFPGVSDTAMEEEQEKFCCYWKSSSSQSALKTDWDQAWKGWAINTWGEKPVTPRQPIQEPVPGRRVDKHLESQLFELCEEVLGKRAPTDSHWFFNQEIVKEAEKRMGKQSRAA